MKAAPFFSVLPVIALVAISFCGPCSLAQAQSETAQTTAKFKINDWAMWGGTIGRNMISKEKSVSFEFDLRKKENVIWSAQLGSQTYGNPIVAGGKVWVGTNNGAEYRPKQKDDK